MSAAANTLNPGGFDQRGSAGLFGVCDDDAPLHTRTDVVSFRTGALPNDTTLLGKVEMALWVSTDASDTDFTAKLCLEIPASVDWPEGLSINLTDSIQRCRYREGYTSSLAMPREDAVCLEFELYPTCALVQAGQSLRLDISSSNFPRFDVNDNSGSGIAGVEAGAGGKAQQRVWHSAEHPSCMRMRCYPQGPPAAKL